MTSSLVDYVLLAALALTSGCVLATYLKLRHFERHHRDYKHTLDQSAEALRFAGHSMGSFAADGQRTLIDLGQRIDEARKTLAALEEGVAAARSALSALDKAGSGPLHAGSRVALRLVGDDATA